MNTTFFIYANHLSNYATAIAGFINLAFMLEIDLNGFIQRKDLNDFVSKDPWGHDTWKMPLYVMTVLAILSIGIYYTPYIGANLGWATYIMPILSLIVQSLLMLDYRKTLMRHITESWYLKSTIVSQWISWASVFIATFFLITQLAVTNY